MRLMIPVLLLGALAAVVVPLAWVGTHDPAMDRLARPAPLHVVPLDSPAPAGSALPQLHASSHGVILSWVERVGGRATLAFAQRTASGWSPAQAVASGEGWFVNWADVPSVVRLADGTLAAHWLERNGAGTYAYDVRLAWSRDEGRTWSAPFSPHDDGTQTEHGFASLFEVPGGGLGVAWLDGRSTGGHGGGHGEGAMTLRFAAYDREWRRAADLEIDGRVCDCCPTSVAVTREGPVVAYRDRSDDEVRDIAVSRLAGDSWTVPAPLASDQWQIHACPVNGPALAADGSRVAAAWFTAAGDEPRALAAFSTDAGRSFAAPIRLDDAGSVGRVGVALLRDGSAIASYMEVASGAAELRLRRVTPAGRRGAPVRVAVIDGGRASGYPRLVGHQGELIVAWTEGTGDASRVRTARAHLE
jgi:hypothetical protein